jgi:outer membrane lipoprotein-sorting protein
MRKAIEAGGLTFNSRGRENVYGRDTQVILIDTPYENADDYDGARFVINQDIESKILLRIRVYDRDARLVENYGYENLNLDARLSDADFDPKNPEYDFRAFLIKEPLDEPAPGYDSACSLDEAQRNPG